MYICEGITQQISLTLTNTNMSTKTKQANVIKNNNATAKKQATKKQTVKTANVLKKQTVSLWKLMQDANKDLKNEIYSLSGSIKLVQCLPANNPFIQAIDLDLEGLTPVFILKNMANVPNFKMINGELFKTVTIKTVKTDKLKKTWSIYDILICLYYEGKK